MSDQSTPKGDRIAKVIARAGLASRRDAEVMIVEGRVSVNGQVIESAALNVTPQDRVVVDGQMLAEPEAARVWLYHKPLGLVTTTRDEQGRETVFDTLPEDMPRVMSIGRLDLNSEGLLLLTNDGALKRRLELPSTGWLRRYRVRVRGTPTEAQLAPLLEGMTLDGDRFAPMQVTLDRQQGANAWLTIGLREGRNREIRRAMEAQGFLVNRLIRISYGPFQLGNLKAGEVEEIRARVLRDQLGEPGMAEDSETKNEGARGPKRGPRPAGKGPRKDGKPPFKSAGRRDEKPTRAPAGKGTGKGTGKREGDREDRPFRKGPRPEARSEDRGDKPFRKGPPREDRGDKPFRKGPPREDREDRPFRKGPRPDARADERGDKPFRKGPPREDRGDKPFRKGPPREDREDRPFRKGPPREDREDRPFRKGPRPEARDGERPFRPRRDDDRPGRPDRAAERAAEKAEREEKKKQFLSDPSKSLRKDAKGAPKRGSARKGGNKSPGAGFYGSRDLNSRGPKK